VGRGRYLCFEGVNGCGKSTVTATVEAEIIAAGHRVCPIMFPSGRSTAGMLVRSYLRGDQELQNPKAMIYLYTADAHLVDPWLRANLASGMHVVADRHTNISGRVYQLAHHTKEHIEQLCATTDLMVPDDLFIIDVPVEVALERIQMRAKYESKHYETKEVALFEEYRARYLELASTAAARGLAQRCHVLNGMWRPSELAVRVFELLGLGREALG
jgi:dTMP kinase